MMFLRKMALPGTKAITSSSFELQRSQKHKFVIGHCQRTAENNSLQKMRGEKKTLIIFAYVPTASYQYVKPDTFRYNVFI